MIDKIKYVNVQVIATSSKRKNIFFGKETENKIVEIVNSVKSDSVADWLYHVLRNYFLSKHFFGRYTVSEELEKKLLKDYRHKVDGVDREENGKKVIDLYVRELPKEILPLKFRGNRITYYELDLGQNWLNKFRDIAEFLDEHAPKNLKKLTAPQIFEIYETYLAKSKSDIKKSVVLKCEDDYIWYSLDNNAARIYEGSKAKNCIGSKEHHQGLENGTIKFLSLQKQGKSHLTLKYNPKTRQVEEIKGTGNSIPKEIFWQFIDYIVDHLKLIPVGDAKHFFNYRNKKKSKTEIKSYGNDTVYYLYL